jgi:hypothetical protein
MTKKSEVKRTKWSRSQLEGYIRNESLTSQNVFFTEHVNAQMRTRKITKDLVMATLQKGKIKRTPEPDLNTGDLKCRMEHYVAGFDIGVVVAISDDDPTLILVTAMHV